jgi:hypothetical protein
VKDLRSKWSAPADDFRILFVNTYSSAGGFSQREPTDQNAIACEPSGQLRIDPLAANS